MTAAGMTRIAGAMPPTSQAKCWRIMTTLFWHGSCLSIAERFRRNNRMIANARPKVSYVRGADGSPLSLSDLPDVNNRRWVVRHKANVVAAVRGGLISLEDVCQRYELTVEEFLAWSNAVDRFGVSALRATRVQEYRR
jgi:hypothetical protein